MALSFRKDFMNPANFMDNSRNACVARPRVPSSETEMTDRLKELLDERPWLLADGATGSNLFDRGLQSGDAPELWNADHPDRIAALHRNFIEAGADIILTNSFGGTRYRLKLHKAEHRVRELNERAASIARSEAAKSGRVVLVAGG